MLTCTTDAFRFLYHVKTLSEMGITHLHLTDRLGASASAPGAANPAWMIPTQCSCSWSRCTPCLAENAIESSKCCRVPGHETSCAPGSFRPSARSYAP